MKLKQQLDDFRVRELLAQSTLRERGPWRVYRVTKRKLTSLEAAARLAEAAGVAAGEVSMAGLKDRQGITVQHMAVPEGREVLLRHGNLRIETIGFAAEELGPQSSEGNAFEIAVRGLRSADLETLRATLPLVREEGLINYFDEQRFGNLRHGQGWIALDLMRGDAQRALRRLLCARSPRDDERTRAFKTALDRAWGDWRECREIAGRWRSHHSVFDHLKSTSSDFAGAFFHVSSRLRLIHLYAFQSHLWNRAVAEYVRRRTPPELRVVVSGEEGPLVFPAASALEPEEGFSSFRIPGPRLEDVAVPLQRELLEDALARAGLVPGHFEIRGVSGFQLKGEDRSLRVRPLHLRVRPAEEDALNRGLRLVRVRFDLPRGAYATLVVRRLFARPVGSAPDGTGAPRESPRAGSPRRTPRAPPRKE